MGSHEGDACSDQSKYELFQTIDDINQRKHDLHVASACLKNNPQSMIATC